MRIQVGRLRQRLAEYYRTEGKADELIIDLPKGTVQTNLRTTLYAGTSSLPCRGSDSACGDSSRQDWPESAPVFISSFGLVGLAMAIAIACAFIYWSHLTARTRSSLGGWTPELQELWRPFVDSKQPLILAIEDPLFVELNSEPGIYYRDKSLNQWKDVVGSPAVASLRAALKNPDIQPSRYYTAYGEVGVSFLLGRLLGPREQNFSILKTSQLSWQQLADNNVLFVGVQNLFFDEQLHGMPLDPQFVPLESGIRNVHPRPGEPTLFTDKYSTAPTEEGLAYALVTHVPGPLRNNDVESFTSSRSAGYVAAVQWFTDPALAKVLVTKLKEASGGKMPRYYQVVLRVKFRDDVPTETTYVLSRELR